MPLAEQRQGPHPKRVKSALTEAQIDAAFEEWYALYPKDRTGALLPYPSAFAAEYLKRALGRVCKATARVQERLTDERTGYPRDVALMIAPAPARRSAVENDGDDDAEAA